MDVIGHRGAAGLVEENTLESIIKALRYPIQGIEIDVHVCKSGEVVVIHDETLNRTTNGSGKVEDYTLAELKQFVTKDGYAIPTLNEVLEIIDASCMLNVELKGANSAQSVIEVLEAFISNSALTYDQFILSSFEHSQLFEAKKLQPKFKLGVLTEEDITAVLNVAKELNAYAIHPPIHSLTFEPVQKAKELGFKVFVWTVNAKQLIAQCKTWNVDGIITDFPNFVA